MKKGLLVFIAILLSILTAGYIQSKISGSSYHLGGIYSYRYEYGYELGARPAKSDKSGNRTRYAVVFLFRNAGNERLKKLFM